MGALPTRASVRMTARSLHRLLFSCLDMLCRFPFNLSVIAGWSLILCLISSTAGGDGQNDDHSAASLEIRK